VYRLWHGIVVLGYNKLSIEPPCVMGQTWVTQDDRQLHVCFYDLYTVFHKKASFLFFYKSVEWWSIYTKVLPNNRQKH